MDIEEAKFHVANSLKVFLDHTVESRPLPRETKDYISGLIASAFLSGVTTCTGILIPQDGSEVITPQSMQQIALEMARSFNADIKQVAI